MAPLSPCNPACAEFELRYSEHKAEDTTGSRSLFLWLTKDRFHGEVMNQQPELTCAVVAAGQALQSPSSRVPLCLL
jgi:hypothetical protein